ncbi:MAG: hypothetical protein ACRDY5_09095, partial [Acidimicrobiales bacterium]
DRVAITASQLLDRVCGLLGGWAAELAATGEHSSGAADDLERAALLARRMVADYGMSDGLGPFTARGPGAVGIDGTPSWTSQRVLAEVDAEVQRVLAGAGRRAAAILEERRATLDAIAEALMEVETLEGEALDALLLAGLPRSTPVGF